MDPSSSFPFESWKPGGLIVGGFVNLSTNYLKIERLGKHNTEQQHISWRLTLPSISAQSSFRQTTDPQPVRIATQNQDHSPNKHTVRAVSVTFQFSRSSDKSFTKSSSPIRVHQHPCDTSSGIFHCRARALFADLQEDFPSCVFQ